MLGRLPPPGTRFQSCPCPGRVMAAQASKPMLTSAQAALKIWKHEPAAADSLHPESGPDGPRPVTADHPAMAGSAVPGRAP
jgi:hypothetical protein